MNKTKKRAAKRKQNSGRNGLHFNKTDKTYRWPFPLYSEFKIQNIKAYRTTFNCTLGAAIFEERVARDSFTRSHRSTRPQPQQFEIDF